MYVKLKYKEGIDGMVIKPNEAESVGDDALNWNIPWTTCRIRNALRCVML